MSSTPTTTPAPGVTDYIIGVIVIIVGSSLQSLGLTVLKMSHLHNIKALQAQDRRNFVKEFDDYIPEYHDTSIDKHDDEYEYGNQKGDMLQIVTLGEVEIEPAMSLAEKRLKDLEEGGDAVVLHEMVGAEQLKKDKWKGVLIWLFGFLIFLVGNIGDFVALGLTRQSVVTLVGSWALVVNTMTAKVLLNEEVIWMDLGSIMLIVIGIIFTVLASDENQDEWDLPRLVARYKETDVVILLVILAAIIFVGLSLMWADLMARKRKAKKKGLLDIGRPKKFIKFVYCFSPAMVGVYSVLFGKATSGLLLPTLVGDNKFTDVFAVLIVVVFVISLPSQMALINYSLSVNDALYHIPNYYVWWNAGSIISGAIFYFEMSNFDTRSWVLFPLGVIILFVGVFLVNVSMRIKTTAESLLQLERRRQALWDGGEGPDGMRSLALYTRWHENEWSNFDFDSHFKRLFPHLRSVRFLGRNQQPSMISAFTTLHRAPEPPVAYSLPKKTSSVLGNYSSLADCPSPDSMAPRSLTPGAHGPDDIQAGAYMYVADQQSGHHVSMYPVASFASYHPANGVGNHVTRVQSQEARWSMGSAHDAAEVSSITSGRALEGGGAVDEEQERLKRMYQSTESGKRFITPPQVSKSGPPPSDGVVVLGAHLATEQGVLFGTPPHQQIGAQQALARHHGQAPMPAYFGDGQSSRSTSGIPESAQLVPQPPSRNRSSLSNGASSTFSNGASSVSDSGRGQGSAHSVHMGAVDAGGNSFNLPPNLSQRQPVFSAYGPTSTYGSSQMHHVQPLSQYGGSQPPSLSYGGQQLQQVYGGSPTLAPTVPRRAHHLAPLSHSEHATEAYPGQHAGFMPGRGMIL